MTQTNQNLEKYYSSLGASLCAKTNFVKAVADECKKEGIEVAHATIRQWVKGCNKTKCEAKLRILSKVSGISVENLFNNTLD